MARKKKSDLKINPAKFSRLVKDIIWRLRETGNSDLVDPFEVVVRRVEEGRFILYSADLERLHQLAMYGDSLLFRESLLSLFALAYVPHKSRDRERSLTRERVSQHRRRLKMKGYRTVSFSVSLQNYKMIQQLKKEMGDVSYSYMFAKLVRDRLERSSKQEQEQDYPKS